jgi:hypothetical protein
MKRFLLLLLLLNFLIECFAIDYYSQGSVTPNTLTNWNVNPGGGGATPGSFTSPGDKFIIQTGHAMTTSATWTVGGTGSTLQIQTGAILQGNNLIQFTGTFQIDNGGTYIHNNVGSVAQTAGNSIFGGTESFGASSNFEIRNWPDNITGLPNTSPGISWGNLIVNLQADIGGTWNWNFADGQTVTVNGDLDIRATYASSAAELRLTPTGTHIINVGGDLLLSGTKTQVSLKKRNTTPLDGYTTMQVNGNISLTGSAQLDLGINTTSTTAIGLYDLRFKGNFSAAAGTTITSASATPYLVANGTSAQTLSCVPTLDCNFRVASGATVNLTSTLTTGTNRTVAVSGILNQNNNIMTVNGRVETAGGTFNSNAAFTVGISCSSCSSDGTYNTVTGTWCTLAGTKGTINFSGNSVSLNNNISTTFLSAGHFSIGSPGDIYFVNATATNTGSTFVAGYFTKANCIFSLDPTSYISGANASYYGQGGTLRIGSVDGIVALPNVTNGNVRTGGATRDYNNSGTNNFEYFGVNLQATGNGLPTAISGTLKINNTAGIATTGVTLSQNTTVNGVLDLTNGKLTTTASQLMNIANDATAINYSGNSFVNGPLKKTGDDPFTFPVGVGSIYAPIGITNVLAESISDQFTAEYIRANPQSTSPYGPGVGTGLDHVSSVEYWTLQQNAGAAFKKVSLDVHLLSFCMNLASTYVSQWNGSVWTKEGASILSGPFVTGSYETGTIRSTNNITGFTGVGIAFTLSTDLPFSSNPLPITLISFDALKLSSSRSSIAWELAACCSPAAKFEVQRAGSDKNFITINTIDGSTVNRFYTYTDNGLQDGANYYRLKMKDEAGTITYSRTVAIINGVKGLLLTSLIPTIITDKASLTVAASAAQKMDIIIIDMQGRVVQKQNYTLNAGNTTLPVTMGGLGAGAYQLTGITAEGKTNTIRFIKQ